MYITLTVNGDPANGCYRVSDEKLSQIVAKIALHWNCFSDCFRNNPYQSYPLWDKVRELAVETLQDHGGEFISQGRINRDADLMLANRPEFGIKPYIGCKKHSLFEMTDHFIIFSSVGEWVAFEEVKRRAAVPKYELAKKFVRLEAPIIWGFHIKRENFKEVWKAHLKAAPELYPKYECYWGSAQSTKYDWLFDDV